jgi:hypothetical protein
VSEKPTTTLPTKLLEAFKAYFQTSKFAQENFIKFNKTMTVNGIKREASRYGYTLVNGEEPNFKGVFKLRRRDRELRVAARTLPAAEVWAG